MAKTVGELMTRDPVMLQPNASLKDAARVMRDRDIGDVLVADDGGQLIGLLTDRDIVVRGIAGNGDDPSSTRVIDIVSRELETVSEKDPVDMVITKMRSKAIRRIPVVDAGGKAVGIITIGDLAVDLDARSALADISASEPNR